MPYCQQFKNKIAQWKKELEGVKVLLGEYLKSGEEEKVGEIREKLEVISDEQEKFLEDKFKKKATEILRQWWPNKKEEEKEKFVDQLEFDEKGRITVKIGLDLRDSRVSYFPSLIKTIQGSFVAYPIKTESLDGLEEIENNLHCLGMSRLKSLKKLKRIGGKANFGLTGIESLRALEEIGADLNIAGVYTIKNIKGFRKVFPRLKKIGKEVNSISNISIHLSSVQLASLKPQLEQLIDRGELTIDGTIKEY